MKQRQKKEGASPKIKDEALILLKYKALSDYLLASSTATAQATVAPTIGLLPFRVKEISGFFDSNKKARKP